MRTFGIQFDRVNSLFRESSILLVCPKASLYVASLGFLRITIGSKNLFIWMTFPKDIDVSYDVNYYLLVREVNYDTEIRAFTPERPLGA